MRKFRFCDLLVLILSVMLIIAAYPELGTAGDAVSRGQLANILRNIRQAVIDGDLAAFEKITMPPKPDMKLTPEEFTGVKERFLELFPELSALDPIKFALGEKESLIVARFGLDDKEAIHMRAYRFINTGPEWKLLLKFASKTIDSQNPQADETAIARELETTPDFQLAGEKKKKRPNLPTPTMEDIAQQSGAGFLSVAGKNYVFEHCVAYKTRTGDSEMTVAILTETPIDREKLKSKVKKLGIWTGFKNHVMISFNQEAQPKFFWFWVKKDNLSYSSPAFDMKSSVDIEGDRIMGQVLMKAPQEALGSDYFFEVVFKADIIAP